MFIFESKDIHGPSIVKSTCKHLVDSHFLWVGGNLTPLERMQSGYCLNFCVCDNSKDKGIFSNFFL